MKNVIKIAIALLLSLFFMQCKQEVEQNIIKCEIEGLQKGDKVILALGNFLAEEVKRVDSIEYNGQKSFKLKTAASDINATLILLPRKKNYKEIEGGKGNFLFFLEGYSTLKIKGAVETFPLSDVSGGVYELPDMHKIRKFYDEVKKVEKFAILRFSGKVSKKNNIPIDSLFRLLENTKKLQRDSILPLEKAFIESNPDIAYSAELFHKISLKENIGKCEYLFTQLSKRVKNTPIGKKIGKYVIARKATEVGGIAPNFTIEDSKGKKISLSDYRGKFVLLEFWGTWCGGCVAHIPMLKKIRKDISKDKLVMLSIACKEPSEQVWKNLIEKEKLDWVQALSKNKEVEQLYPYTAFPAFFLVNPEGKVVSKSVGLEQRILEKIKQECQ